MRVFAGLVMAVLCALPLAAGAAAPQRTFVASNGVDANPCSLVAPCRTFGTAVAAVAVGGEVIVLDSAGYGVVTIAKSVSIVAPPGVYAGISVFSGAGVTVDGPGISVVVRGLTVVNQGGFGSRGIHFVQGDVLHVENCVISGLGGGTGIDVVAPGSIANVLDSIVRDNSQGIVFGGNAVGNISRTRVENHALMFAGISVNGNARVAIEDSVVSGSSVNLDVEALAGGSTPSLTVARTLVAGGGTGISAQTNGLPSAIKVTVTDSTISQAVFAGISVQATDGTSRVTAVRNQLQDNTYAMLAVGPGATIVVDGNVITGNGTGIDGTSGVIVTRNNNTVTGNGTDTNGTPYTPTSGI